jgi:hypothetical protein
MSTSRATSLHHVASPMSMFHGMDWWAVRLELAYADP